MPSTRASRIGSHLKRQVQEQRVVGAFVPIVGLVFAGHPDGLVGGHGSAVGPFRLRSLNMELMYSAPTDVNAV